MDRENLPSVVPQTKIRIIVVLVDSFREVYPVLFKFSCHVQVFSFNNPTAQQETSGLFFEKHLPSNFFAWNVLICSKTFLGACVNKFATCKLKSLQIWNLADTA